MRPKRTEDISIERLAEELRSAKSVTCSWLEQHSNPRGCWELRNSNAHEVLIGESRL